MRKWNSLGSLDYLFSKIIFKINNMKGEIIMKIKVFVCSVLVMLAASISLAVEPYCEDWLGTWEVENSDGSSSTWVIYNVPEDTGSSVVLCQAFGKTWSESDACAKPFQILFVTMVGNYSYSEELEVSREMKSVEVTLNDEGDAFTVTGDDYPVIGGTKTSDDIEVPVDWEACPEEQEAEEDDDDSEDDDQDGGDDTDETCLVAFLLDENDPQLNIIRQFRDELLTKSTAGEKLILLYYNKADRILSIIDKNPIIRKTAKKVLESLLPVIKLMTTI